MQCSQNPLHYAVPRSCVELYPWRCFYTGAAASQRKVPRLIGLHPTASSAHINQTAQCLF